MNVRDRLVRELGRLVISTIVMLVSLAVGFGVISLTGETMAGLVGTAVTANVLGYVEGDLNAWGAR